MNTQDERYRILRHRQWNVLRVGRLDEVVVDGAIRFRVKIWDAGRDAFITQWFNDLAPAEDFLSRVEEENMMYVKKGKE
jgi:hypothetical protein